MNNRWNDAEAKKYAEQWSHAGEKELALIAYVSRIAGSDPGLVLHGGGNTSIKSSVKTLTNGDTAAIFVKASGISMSTITPDGFVCLDLARLRKLRGLESLSDGIMANELRMCLLQPSHLLPSIETLMHAFIDQPSIVHTHPDAVLCLTNRDKGENGCKEAFGDGVAVIPYANAGLALARAVAHAIEIHDNCRAVVVMHHGLITWGRTPLQAYEATIDLVNRAQRRLSSLRKRIFVAASKSDVEQARRRYSACAPLVRRLLSPQTADPDKTLIKMHLAPLITEESLEMLSTEKGRQILKTAPITPDYLIRTKTIPLIIDEPDFENMEAFKATAAKSVDEFSACYDAYIRKYSLRLPDFDASSIDLLPRVVMAPGLGIICAGPDIESAIICRDITEQALNVKRLVHETGGVYCGLTEEHLFDMEFRAIQQAKVQGKKALPLIGSAAIVTGAAGAIGLGICEELLSQGCVVAVTDLPGKPLEDAVAYLKNKMTDSPDPTRSARVFGIALDVTDAGSVANAFDAVIAACGGIDIVIINAGLAHVSPLAGMDLKAFQRLERVNIEGTLICLGEAQRRFSSQGMGGDIVLISTKNVFAPGAGFGAYSATKAAAHQLCRIASLEFADINVRVNMVSPDAVFSHGTKKSGLWAEVGPGRMKARGLDEQGLEEYYRQRNLLKARVTAKHVARAALFFVTRQTPTTGATIPVDGGLPDATPR
jgi:rhamnose utilization protein RhaD (predicted bifunctional aldolase and dehydrogenase)/NAD(P)-dependent dehydrogenase (short-subunit alcohol dehydrogenase family)